MGSWHGACMFSKTLKDRVFQQRRSLKGSITAGAVRTSLANSLSFSAGGYYRVRISTKVSLLP